MREVGELFSINLACRARLSDLDFDECVDLYGKHSGFGCHLANAAISQRRRDSKVGQKENGSLKYAIAKVFASILSEYISNFNVAVQLQSSCSVDRGF